MRREIRSFAIYPRTIHPPNFRYILLRDRDSLLFFYFYSSRVNLFSIVFETNRNSPRSAFSRKCSRTSDGNVESLLFRFSFRYSGRSFPLNQLSGEFSGARVHFAHLPKYPGETRRVFERSQRLKYLSERRGACEFIFAAESRVSSATREKTSSVDVSLPRGFPLIQRCVTSG